MAVLTDIETIEFTGARVSQSNRISTLYERVPLGNQCSGFLRSIDQIILQFTKQYGLSA